MIDVADVPDLVKSQQERSVVLPLATTAIITRMCILYVSVSVYESDQSC